jgi:hypothetical protein
MFRNTTLEMIVLTSRSEHFFRDLGKGPAGEAATVDEGLGWGSAVQDVHGTLAAA